MLDDGGSLAQGIGSRIHRPHAIAELEQRIREPARVRPARDQYVPPANTRVREREPLRSRADRDLFHGRRDERGVRAGGNHAEVGSIGLAQAIDPAHGDAKVGQRPLQFAERPLRRRGRRDRIRRVGNQRDRRSTRG